MDNEAAGGNENENEQHELLATYTCVYKYITLYWIITYHSTMFIMIFYINMYLYDQIRI